MSALVPVKDAMRDAGLSPNWWDSRRKNKLRSYCPNNADRPHSVGKPNFKLKVWIEADELIAHCDDCGRIDNFASVIGLKETRSATPINQPTAAPEIQPPDASQTAPDAPTGDDQNQDVETDAPAQPSPDSAPATPAKSSFVFGADFCKQPPSSNSIIRGMLDYDSLAYCWGDSEAGKSFLMLDRDLHIANGMKWCGRKTKQGLVLYIVGEGKHGLIKRVKAWHDHYGLPVSNNIAFRTIPTALCDPKAVDELVAEIKSIVTALNRRPTLIELDTVNRNFGPGDENSTKDMTSFVAGLDALRIATGAAISAVHHCGHGDKTRSRGSIVLHNSVDFEYRVSKEGDCFNDYVTTLEFIKVKDYDKPNPISWKWQLQTLPWADEDDDGNAVPMNSVVFVPTEYEKKNSTSLSRSESIALEALRDALIRHGSESDGVVSVCEDDWKQCAYDLGISTSVIPDSKAKTFRRACTALIEAKRVRHHAGRYWIPAVRQTGQTRT